MRFPTKELVTFSDRLEGGCDHEGKLTQLRCDLPVATIRKAIHLHNFILCRCNVNRKGRANGSVVDGSWTLEVRSVFIVHRVLL